MTKLNVPLKLTPTASAADVRRAINRVALAVASVLHTYPKEFSRAWLEERLEQGLREGRNLNLAIKAREAAEKDNDEIADKALRKVGAELQAGFMQGHLMPGHLQIAAYLQAAVQRAPLKRKQGRYLRSDNWYRNVGWAILIQLFSWEFGISPSRNRASRRANLDPSVCYLFMEALARNNIHLDEKTIQEKIWYGWPGILVRMFWDDIAGQFSVPP